MVCKFSSLLAVVLIYLIEPLLASIDSGAQNGFIVYCPCMGRFGNQAEQLLGSILFAKSLNRTLVLPPFIHYGQDHKPALVPFDDIIQVEPIKEFHDVILMTDFMRLYADKVWPRGSRRFFCYSRRTFGKANNSCDALEGQPFSTFWASFNISEDATTFYKPLTTNPKTANEWLQKYPVSSHRVLTFVGAPSPFPTHETSIHIQKYIKLSKKIEREALEERKLRDFLDKPYVSIHIRHGIDWIRACELLKSSDNLTQLFSSNQCTRYKSFKKLDHELCLPTIDMIVEKLGKSLAEYRQKNNLHIGIVHIATDQNDRKFLQQLKNRLPQINFLTVSKDSKSILGTMIDIYWMTNADIFIGNCVSSFSAFPARIRTEQLHLHETTLYFGYDQGQYTNKTVHDEL